MATLFNPMRKVNGRAGRMFSQTGLGLTICRKLVERMDGSIRLDRPADGGKVNTWPIVTLLPCAASGVRACR